MECGVSCKPAMRFFRIWLVTSSTVRGSDDVSLWDVNIQGLLFNYKRIKTRVLMGTSFQPHRNVGLENAIKQKSREKIAVYFGNASRSQSTL